MGASLSSGQLVTQPAFASQIQNLPSPVGMGNTNGALANLQRGYMIWANAQPSLYPNGGGPLGDGRDVIRFLFNPSTITTDYNIGNASLQAAMLYQVPGDNQNLLAPMLQQTVSFELYFDRTFELNYGGDATSPNDPGVIGCQADVYQFMQFTGITAQLSTSQAQAIQSTGGTAVGSASSGTAIQTTSGGIMMMMPAYVYFGNASQQFSNTGTVTANNQAIGQQMNYYGYISEWTANYTHFTVNMVPIRCVVSVTFTMLPQPDSGTASAVWQDVQQLQGSYAVTPYASGVVPPPTTSSGFPGIS